MRPLGTVRWLFVHTAAYRGDAGVEEIRRWHLARGWSDIGYHYVVRRDGTIEAGRSTDHAGAHVAGVNSHSIGICCEGHGDMEMHTPKQRAALLALCHTLMKRHNVHLGDVLGHREINDLIDRGEVDARWRTAKTCPGVMVSMDEIRAQLDEPFQPDVELADSGATDIEGAQ